MQITQTIIVVNLSQIKLLRIPKLRFVVFDRFRA